jgi:hypothetical protein
MCDSANHSRFPKEDHLPDWVRRDKHGNKGDRVESISKSQKGTEYPTDNKTKEG